MGNRELVLSWMCDEESKYIFEKRCEYVENKNDNAINDIVEKYVPEYGQLKKFYELIDNKKVWIWGAGERLGVIERFMYLAPSVEVCGIIDKYKGNKDTELFGGVTICRPQDVNFSDIDCLVISMKNVDMINEVVKVAKENGIEDKNIIVFSKYFLRNSLIERQYFDDIMKCDEQEIFVDAGVCDLCTSLMFFKWCQKHNVGKMKSIAFEPDPISYKLCEEVKSNHCNYDIELVNKALYSQQTILEFQSNGNSMSCATNGVDGISVEAHT